MKTYRAWLTAAGLWCLLCPGLARADALSALGEAYAMMGLLPFVVSGLGLLVVGINYLATDLRTGRFRKRTAALVALNTGLGLLLSLAGRDLNRHGTWLPNLWTELYVPLAAGLWAAGRARLAPGALSGVRAVAGVLAAALAGVGGALGLYFPQVLQSPMWFDQHSAGLAVGVVALVATALVVLHHYRYVLEAGRSAASLAWLLGVAPVVGIGYLLLLRLAIDALHNWLAASYAYRPYHPQWSATWAEEGQTLLLYVGCVLVGYLLPVAFKTGSPGHQRA